MYGGRGMRAALVVAAAVTVAGGVAVARIALGGAEADRSALQAMFDACKAESAPFRDEYDSMAGCTTATATFNAGRGQAKTLVDSFSTGNVDVGDLEQIPSSPPAEHPGATTRCQVIKHFLAEYMYRAHHPGAEFEECHKAGIQGENEIRNARGQAGRANGATIDASGRVVISYDDGQTETWTLDATANITGISYGGAP
ncbi:MAG: hypothetical protein HY905_18790 [Deltaproteobacteria bacterium]|nr:hypothetical protein [Deltaproteobacteria bacterium]